jgi:hypothetical protein
LAEDASPQNVVTRIKQKPNPMATNTQEELGHPRSGEQNVAKTNSIPITDKVNFVYEKSTVYRTIHADGAWGRNDGFGNIHLTLFNEKPPMPDRGVIRLDPKSGQWVIDATSLEMPANVDMVREMEVDVVMTLPAAVAIRNVLNNFIHTVIAGIEAQQKSQ